MQHLAVHPVYGVLLLMRLVFLSSRWGAVLHNHLFLWLNQRMALNPNTGRSSYFAMLRQGADGLPNALLWERKMYQLSPPMRKSMMQNVFFWKGIVGNRRMAKWRKQGVHVPLFIFISPTFRCNLHCIACYAHSPRPGDLPPDVLDRIIQEQEELGVFQVTLLGGEPFVRKDLWGLFKRYPKTLFTVFTNGTFLGSEAIEHIRKLGNVRLLLSIEGFQQSTDARRGEGVFARVENVLTLCKKANILYGVSVTVSTENFQEVTSEQFLKWVVVSGSFYINYSSYVPTGAADARLRLSQEQMRLILNLGESVMQQYPILITIGQNGSDLVTACDAGGRMIHINAFGDIEPCMFVPWAIDNIKEKGLVAAMQSPFFQIMRGLSETGDPRINPCKAYQSSLVLGILQANANPTRQQQKKEVPHGQSTVKVNRSGIGGPEPVAAGRAQEDRGSPGRD